MTVERLSDAEVEQLAAGWRARLEEPLERASFTAPELTELARRQRAAAHVSDIPGQRRGLLHAAARFERAAAERATAQT